MVGFNDYMNSYLDRRMKYIIEEWNLGTMRDFGDYQVRLRSLEAEIRDMKVFTDGAATKLSDMEGRLEKVRGERQ